MIGNNIPPEYVPSCERGFEDAMKKGGLIGAPIQGIRYTITATDICLRQYISYPFPMSDSVLWLVVGLCWWHV